MSTHVFTITSDARARVDGDHMTIDDQAFCLIVRFDDQEALTRLAGAINAPHVVELGALDGYRAAKGPLASHSVDAMVAARDTRGSLDDSANDAYVNAFYRAFDDERLK